MSCSKSEIENLAQNVSVNLTRSINASKSSKKESALQYLQNLYDTDKNFNISSRTQIFKKETTYDSLYNPNEQQSETSDYSSALDRTPIEELGHKLSSLIEDKKYITRKASLQNWKKVEVTPEIEINIRMERDLSDREKNAIEQIADYLREIITRR